MSESVQVYDSTCRFCGSEKNYGKYLFSNESITTGLIAKIELLFSPEVLLIEENDNLTKFICFHCEMTVNYFSEFFNMVKEAQRQLKEKQSQVSYESQILCHAVNVLKNYGTINLSVGSDGSATCQYCHTILDGAQLTELMNASSEYAATAVFGYCVVCGYKDEIKHFSRHNTNNNSNVVSTSNNLQCPTQCVFANEQQLFNNNDNNDNNVCSSTIVKGKTSRVCDICGKEFRSTGHLNRHKLTHFNVKPFACQICDMKFSQKSVLKTHSLIHKQTNPFNCKWCYQTFRYKTTLQEHTLNYHGSLAVTKTSYECDHCKKYFISKVKLERHYRSHSGEQPFKCFVCNKHFSQKTNLKTHSKKHVLNYNQQRSATSNDNCAGNNSENVTDSDLYDTTTVVADPLLQSNDDEKYLGDILTNCEPLTLDNIQLEDDNFNNGKLSSNTYNHNHVSSTIEQQIRSDTSSSCNMFYDVSSPSYTMYGGTDLIGSEDNNSKSSILDTFCSMSTDSQMCI